MLIVLWLFFHSNLFKLFQLYHYEPKVLVKDYNGIRNAICALTIPIYNTSISILIFVFVA